MSPVQLPYLVLVLAAVLKSLPVQIKIRNFGMMARNFYMPDALAVAHEFVLKQ